MSLLIDRKHTEDRVAKHPICCRRHSEKIRKNLVHDAFSIVLILFQSLLINNIRIWLLYFIL